MSGRVRVRVRVTRPKYDENGNEIPHVHKNKINVKAYKFKNGDIHREISQEPTSEVVSVAPATTYDAETLDLTTKVKKDKYLRLTKIRTKKNTVKYHANFSSSDSDIDIIEPERITRGSRFSEKQPYDTTINSTFTTTIQEPTLVSLETVESSDDTEGPPRTTQSFTSFMGESQARTQSETHTATQTLDEMYKPKEKNPILQDPFNVVDDINSQPWYPPSRRIPTHTIGSDELHDVFDDLRITNLDDIDLTDNEKKKLHEQLKDKEHQKMLDEKRSKIDIITIGRNRTRGFVPGKEDNEGTVSMSSAATRTRTGESNEYETDTRNASQTDELTTVSALVTATNTEEGEFVEATHSDSNAVKYVEVTDSSGADKDKKKGRARTKPKWTNNSDEYTADSIPSAFLPTDGLTTVSELVTATSGTADYIEAANSNEGDLYVEMSTDRFGDTGTESQNISSPPQSHIGEAEEDYEEDYEEEEGYEEEDEN